MIVSVPLSSPGESLRRLDETPPLRQRVHEQLESLITAGAIRPGMRLVEGDLAQTLGVSRGPIREALQLLARDGFVDLRPRQGAFVHVPTPKEIDDFYDVRSALETEAARLAALRITPEAAALLRGLLEVASDLLERGKDPSSAIERPSLHEQITIAADNPLLAQMLDTVNKRATWYQSRFEPQTRRKAWQEHSEIVRAIISGDSEAARSAMARHIHSAHDSFISQMPDTVEPAPAATEPRLGRPG